MENQFTASSKNAVINEAILGGSSPFMNYDGCIIRSEQVIVGFASFRECVIRVKTLLLSPYDFDVLEKNMSDTERFQYENSRLILNRHVEAEDNKAPAVMFTDCMIMADEVKLAGITTAREAYLYYDNLSFVRFGHTDERITVISPTAVNTPANGGWKI